ncbi:MAG: flagellar hook capping FlgD N-terminal domain-containing protein [Terracidiphilus sp.]|jgi:flagellar basal-body rod modification protein FlgD
MAAAILNHHMTGAQALSGRAAAPVAAAASTTPARANATSNTSSSASGDSATISANDFLTLLVTEMQNQDPTADTDPNEYINQLVNVNSLEQLISINQTLATDLGSSTAAASASAPLAQADGAQAQDQPSSTGAATMLPGALNTAATQLAPGNLGIPAANSAAQSVAQALSGRPRVE